MGPNVSDKLRTVKVTRPYVVVFAQCLGNAALGYGVLAVDALGVDPE
jgi:hypothetical protein